MNDLQTTHIFDPDALVSHAFSLHQAGNVNDAIPLYQQLHVQFPNEKQIMQLLGAAWLQLENFNEAVQILEKSLNVDSNQPMVLSNLGYGYHKLKRFEEALIFCDRAIALAPDFADAHNNRCNTLIEFKQFDKALVSCDRAITLKPNFADAHNNRSAILKALKRFEEALESSNNAIALKPDFAGAHINRGNSLNALKRFEEALISYDRAVALKPDFSDAYNNRGAALKELKDFDEAIKCCDQAISLQSDYADAYLNKAFVKLTMGNYEEGWKLYEWRWSSVQKEGFRAFDQPLWLGESSILDKTILIHEEQGLGDVIQMCRYLPMLKMLGANVILETRSYLIPLLSTLKGDVMFVKKGKHLPAFDFQCPIMSLSLAFKTTVDTIPAVVPYLFADIDKQIVWQKRLGKKDKPRIGFVCSGSTVHQDDSKRSLSLNTLKPLLNIPFEFHMLQKEIRPDDQKVLNDFPHVKTHQEDLVDFSDTAALINEMDLVISVDTSVAHLAGALGKPVWVLISWVPDFRWLLDRTDSPWYPSATLFRQPELGNWEGAIEKICMRLQQGSVFYPSSDFV